MKYLRHFRGNANGSPTDEFLDALETQVVPEHSIDFDSPEKMALPKILVIDDDPLFRAKTRQIAHLRNLPITVASSLSEATVMSTGQNMFDIAIVDYYLDDLKTSLRGTEIASLLESTPVILISNSDHCIEDSNPFPKSVRKFVNKKFGINAIIDIALKEFEHSETI